MIMDGQSPRRVLFIGLRYQDYTAAIVDEMRRTGAAVDFVDIQPRTLFFNALRILSETTFNHYREWHHTRAIRRAARQSYDTVVFLQSHQMSLQNLALLRGTQPDAEFVLYNWDSIKNHDYLAQAPYFDRVYTFDRADAEAHGFHYLPLFCTRSMQGLSSDRVRPTAVYTVGNIVNTRRYHAVKAFAEYCRLEGLAFHAYLKVSPVVYLRLLREGVTPRGVRFSSITPSRFRELIETSGAVFDFANHEQSGQTMRTMENLCAGKKVITNNSWVKREDFFSDDRFFVYADLDFSGVAAFLAQPLRSPESALGGYHIQSFVRTLLGPASMAGA
jgi:hypothetical protein